MDDPMDETKPVISHEDQLAKIERLPDSDALAECVDIIYAGDINDRVWARTIIDTGLERGKAQATEFERNICGSDGDREWNERSEKEIKEALDKVVGLDEDLRKLVTNYGLLYQANKRLHTYDVFSPEDGEAPSAAQTASVDAGVLDAPEGNVMDLDDPWAEGNDEDVDETTASPAIDDPWETNSNKSAPASNSISELAIPNLESQSIKLEPISLTLQDFLSQSILTIALEFASSADLHALGLVSDVHYSELFPFRFTIWSSLPAWVAPEDLKKRRLLPNVGDDGNELGDFRSFHLFDWIPTPNTESTVPQNDLLDTDGLSKWFASRVESLDSVGALDLQLAWVQHGASLGIPNLDALGEDLSLLSRLIYDANLSPAQHEKWTLATWKQATEGEIVSAYLANSTPSNIVGDIRRLVLPYLYVLESRAERAGKPDTQLVERLLHEAVLSLPLHKALPVFEASKATIPMSERLLRNDQNVARLALACLYGSDEREVWSTMSGIFECLPVWDVSGGDLESDKEATATTLDSIATFVRPHASSDKPPSAKDLFIFFAPLPFAALSRALDILDVHLESGEILARWNTAVQLRFLLQSARDKEEQAQLAEKMIRRQAGMKDLNKWTRLWEDMCRLNGGDDALLRGAFGTLSMEDMMRAYLSGILGSGNFDAARRMIRRFETEYDLSDSLLEEVALATSRELYDNAETGNIHTGDMKLAYDCLSVPASSEAIRNERSFIEATSRLASFSSLSLTPFQIRHAKSKLSLIRRVLSTSDDAYKHDTIIVELAEKLGLGDTSSRGQILGMLADAAVSHGEYDLAAGYTQRLIDLVKDRRRRRSKEEDDELRTVVWKTCLELGRQDWSDIDSRILLLGRATEYCPAESIPSILAVWRNVEDGSLKLSQAAKRRRLAGIKNPTKSDPTSVATSPVVGSEEERVLGSRTAARAAKMALGFGERFKDQIPFRSGLSPHLPSLASSREPSRDRGGGSEGRRSLDSDRDSLSGLGFGTGHPTDAERVSRHARKALVRGVGWLLGADERDVPQ